MSIGVLQSALKPWEIFDMPNTQKQAIYRDWGVFYKRTQRNNNAIRSFDMAVELKPDDWNALYNRSKCKRKMANPTEALKDVITAKDILKTTRPDELLPYIDMEICDALYELNRFEDCYVECSRNSRKFATTKASKSFRDRLAVLQNNFKDTIGESLDPFVKEGQKQFCTVAEIMASEKIIDERPMWKKYKEKDMCDVMSIPEREKMLYSPLEIARRKRMTEVYSETYLNRSWTDVLFLQQLRKNPNLMLPQCVQTTPILKKTLTKNFAEVKKFLKMLQARSPLYNERFVNFSNKELYELQRTAGLHRIQYQTQRDMRTVLRHVKLLRSLGQIDELAHFVEAVMGDYVVTKTNRIMCWKFEFINEVYNTLALAYADQFKVNKAYKKLPVTQQVLSLLNLPLDKPGSRMKPFSFGDRTTHSDVNKVDPETLQYLKTIARLEKRMVYAKYSIEKCYLYHSLAAAHLKQGRIDECFFMAKKGIQETKNCNSYIWRFLNVMQICKANALLHRVERGKESYLAALVIAHKLKSVPLCTFATVCFTANESELDLKKRNHSSEARRLKSVSSHQGKYVFDPETPLATSRTILRDKISISTLL